MNLTTFVDYHLWSQKSKGKRERFGLSYLRGYVETALTYEDGAKVTPTALKLALEYLDELEKIEVNPKLFGG